MTGLAQRILAVASTRPESAALMEGSEMVSYGQLLVLADEIGGMLAGTGPLAILAHKGSEAIAAVLDCLRQDRPFLLVSPLLPASTRDRLLADSGCTAILNPQSRNLELLAPDRQSIVPAGTGFMLTTSGSTGTPKIVLLDHPAVDRFAAWAGVAFGIGEGTPVLSLAPLNFDLSLLDIWATLWHGGTVVLVPPAKAVDGAYVLKQLVDHRVEVAQGVPMFFQLVAGAGQDQGSGALRHLVLTGDETPQPTLTAMRRLFPAATLHNVYGCTETNDSLMHSVPPEVELPAQLLAGSPVAGAEVLLVDDAGREVAGPGEGELLVRTPFQARGYLDPALTEGKFVQPPGRQGPFFRSGDLFRRDADDGLKLLGRTDHQVKIRGVAVNTAEVERVLKLHANVGAAAVMTAPDPVGGRRLLAVVERKSGSAVSGLELRNHCATHLPRTAVPSQLRVTDEALPLTTTGKINRLQAQREHFPETV